MLTMLRISYGPLKPVKTPPNPLKNIPYKWNYDEILGYINENEKEVYPILTQT
jgi:hypothetical protein